MWREKTSCFNCELSTAQKNLVGCLGFFMGIILPNYIMGIRNLALDQVSHKFNKSRAPSRDETKCNLQSPQCHI